MSEREAHQAFDSFVRWESATRDTIDVKKTYIDMAGDLVAGVMLSQIVYWHLPNRETGGPRMKVERDGHLWVAKTREDWWDECRIKPRQADRALKILEDAGLVVCEIYQFASFPTKHVRIHKAEFMRAFQATLKSNPKPKVRSNGSGNSISRNGENDVTDSGKPYTETTTETTAEITVVEERTAQIDDVAAKCLLLLNRTRGFPKDDTGNAAELAEHREDFPKADPEEVCRDLKAWARAHPEERVDRTRLRNFFKSAHNKATVREARDADEAPIGGEDGRRRRREGYEDLSDPGEGRSAVPETGGAGPREEARGPGLLSLVPDDQRGGEVGPEVRKILTRRLLELAEGGAGKSLERACEELWESPWIDRAGKLEVISVAMTRAEGKRGGDARSA